MAENPAESENPTAQRREARGRAKARKKRGPFRAFLRWALRLAVVSVLLLAFGVATLCYTPFSSDWADERLKREWLAATGLCLDFSRAEWTLARGAVRIDAPEVSDPQTSESLLSLASIEAAVDVRSALRAALSGEGDIRVTDLALAGPLEIFFEETKGRLSLDSKLDRLRQTLQSRFDDAPTSGAEPVVVHSGSALRVRFEQASLTGLNATLIHSDEEGRRGVVMAQNVDLLAEFDGGAEPKSVLCVGSLQGREGSAGFRLRLEPSLDRQEAKIDLTIDPFDSSKHLLAELPQAFRCSRAEAIGMLRRGEDGAWTLHSDANIPEVTLVGAGVGGADQTFRDGSLFSALEWSESEGAIKLTAGEFSSRDCSAKAQGRIEFAKPHQYQLSVESFVLRGESLALVERSFFKENYISKPAEAVVELRGEIRGRWGESFPDSETLEYSLRDIAVALPDLPEPITNLRLSGKLTEKKLAVDEGYAVIQGIPFSVTGSFEGERPLAGKISRAQLKWQTAGEAAGISDLLANGGKGPAAQYRFKGGVAGAGTLRFKKLDFNDWEELIRAAEIEGKLSFEDAELGHDRFKRPIERLRGAVEYSGDRAILRNVSGEIDGAEFMIDGRVDGDGDFWVKPVADFALRLTGDLARIPEYCALFGQKPPEDFPPLEGKAALACNLRGPLEEWRALELRGRLRVDNFALPFDALESTEVGGTLRAPRLDLDLAPDRIRIDGLTAAWEGVNLRLDGSIGPNDGAFTAKADGPMIEFQKCVVDALDRFEMNEKTATATAEVKLLRKDREKKPMRRLAELIPRSEAGPESAPANGDAKKPRFWERWEMDAHGEAWGAGCKFTHDSMPAPLEEIYGKVRFDMKHIWTPEPVPMRAGKNGEGLRATVDVAYPHDGKPWVIDGRVVGEFVDLDEFIRAWRKADPAKLKPPKPITDPDRQRVVIKVNVETDRFRYKGLEGKNLDGSVTYTFFNRHRGEIWWKDVKAEAKEGRVNVSGNYLILKAADTQAYDIQATDMDVADLLRAFFKLDKQGGIASGLATGRLVLRQDEARGKGFDGEGEIKVRDSRFVSNAILGAVGRVLRIEALFGDISFPQIEGKFLIVDDGAVFEGENYFSLENPSLLHPLNIKVQGKLGPARALDLDLRLQFLSRVGGIPVVGAVWDIVNKFTGQILRYRVVGTLDNPEVTLLP